MIPFNNWIEVFSFIKKTFCERCEINHCSNERYLFCIEQFLYIVENWEISNDSKI